MKLVKDIIFLSLGIIIFMAVILLIMAKKSKNKKKFPLK